MGETHFTLINHPACLANENHWIKGQVHHPITEKGWETLNEMIGALKKKRFDRIYSSDLDPCLEAASYLSKELQVEHRVEKELRVRQSGCWTGKKIPLAQQVSDLLVEMHDRESDNELRLRAVSALKKISRGEPGKQVLLVLNSSLTQALLQAQKSLPIHTL